MVKAIDRTALCGFRENFYSSWQENPDGRSTRVAGLETTAQAVVFI